MIGKSEHMQECTKEGSHTHRTFAAKYTILSNSHKAFID
jgi:hypothetical protein